MGYRTNSFDSAICKQQGRLFVLGVDKGFDSTKFAQMFMQSSVARRLDREYSMLHGTGEKYWLEELEAEVILELGSIVNPEVAEWAGHLYRFWHYYTGESSEEIYKQAPFDAVCRVFLAYHCMDWCEAVDRFKEHACNIATSLGVPKLKPMTLD